MVTRFDTCAVAAYTFSMITNGRRTTHNSRMNRRRIFKLGGRVGHVTYHVWQLFNVKRPWPFDTERTRNWRRQGGRQWTCLRVNDSSLSSYTNKSCIVNRQIGVGDSKNCHVTCHVWQLFRWKSQRSRSRISISSKNAVDGHINFKLRENYRGEGRHMWYIF